MGKDFSFPNWWHANDGIAIVSLDAAMAIFDFYSSTGADTGINLNPKKTVVMMPPFSVAADRELAIQQYLDRGLLRCNILTHPDDFVKGSELWVAADKVYGVKYLGIFIGSDTFISNRLEVVMENLESQGDELMAYAAVNAHRAFYLLQKSFC